MRAGPHQAMASSITAIAAANMSPSNTRRASSKQASRLRWAASAIVEPVLGPAKPDPGDNALAETVNGLYKAELIWRRGPWRTIEAVELATLEWVDWFNHRRLLEPIGHIPPAEAEANYYAALEQYAMAA